MAFSKLACTCWQGRFDDALAGNHIWAERYDRTLENLFAVQDDIVRAVTAGTVKVGSLSSGPLGGEAAAGW